MADAAVSKTAGGNLVWVRLPPSAPAVTGSQQDNGAWLSLVERSVRVAEVGGSNPLAPTNSMRLGACSLRLGEWFDQASSRKSLASSLTYDLVAQLDRASASGAEGCGFEPRRGRFCHICCCVEILLHRRVNSSTSRRGNSSTLENPRITAEHRLQRPTTYMVGRCRIWSDCLFVTIYHLRFCQRSRTRFHTFSVKTRGESLFAGPSSSSMIGSNCVAINRHSA